MSKIKQSAGILLYRFAPSGLPELFLAHMGGPFWIRKDAGSWTIPKGELDPEEDPLKAAIREFEEEIGTKLTGPFRELLPIKQKSGKLIHAWAVEGDLDANTIKSNVFELEWPPRSGKIKKFPEIDRTEWFGIAEARKMIIPGQSGFIDEFLSFCPGLNPGA